MWDSYSAFGCEQDPTHFLSSLKRDGITDLYVCGLALDFCVGNTAIDAIENGLNVYVITDATEPTSQATGKTMLADLRKAGVKLVTSEEIGYKR